MMKRQIGHCMNDRYHKPNKSNNYSSGSRNYNDNKIHQNNNNNNTVKRIQQNRPPIAIITCSSLSTMPTSTATSTTKTLSPTTAHHKKIQCSMLQSLKGLIGNSSRRIKNYDEVSRMIETSALTKSITKNQKMDMDEDNHTQSSSSLSYSDHNNTTSFIMDYTQRFGEIRGKSVEIMIKDSFSAMETSLSTYENNNHRCITTCSMTDQAIRYTVYHDTSLHHFVISAHISLENGNNSSSQISLLENRIKVLEEKLKSNMKKFTSLDVSLLYKKSSNNIIFRIAISTLTSTDNSSTDFVSERRQQPDQKIKFGRFCIFFNYFIKTSINIRSNLI